MRDKTCLSKLSFICFSLALRKRNSIIELELGYTDSTVGWNYNPCLLFDGDHWIRKRGNYLTG